MFSPELRETAEAIVARFPVKRSALLPLLHLVQHQDGYVSEDGIAECAELLDLTKAEVAAVSTFYTMYKREPMGRHLVSVCTNFSCAVRGGKATYDRLREHLGVGHDETTPDGAITLEHAECLGNCEGAPVVTVDYLNYEWVDPDAAVELVEALRAGNPPQPTRGMIPPGVREVSYRLAGIGPIDESAPGQRLGLATAEDGAVPTPDAGVGAGGVGVIAFGANGDGGAGQVTPGAGAVGSADVPGEVPPPEKQAGAITDEEAPPSAGTQSQEAEADRAEAAAGEPVGGSTEDDPVDAQDAAATSAPSDADPALQGADAEPEDNPDPRTDKAPGTRTPGSGPAGTDIPDADVPETLSADTTQPEHPETAPPQTGTVDDEEGNA